jgi:hypothetical protein
MPILDRIPSVPDPVRRELFDVADLEIAGVPVAQLDPRPYTWWVPFHLNQGREGACVPHGCIAEALARPKPVNFEVYTLPHWAERAKRVQAIRGHTNKMVAQALAFDAYDWCRNNDEWPGMNYSGTSAAAGARMMAALNLWRKYRWATNVRDFVTAMSRYGPGTVAIDWKTGMMRPDSEGFIHPTGQVEGGHQLLAMAYSAKRFRYPSVGLWQSWGDDPPAIWWMTVHELEEVAAGNGEFAIPTIRGI